MEREEEEGGGGGEEEEEEEDIHKQISDAVETTLLPINTARETFLQKSGAMSSIDWIFITRVPAWRWLGEYVKLNKKF